MSFAERLANRLADSTSRRSLLAAVGAAALAASVGDGAEGARDKPRRRRRARGSEPIAGGWYGFCGHYWTTGSCPSPFVLPRIDANGFPLRPSDGAAVDNLGRIIDEHGFPVDPDGGRQRAPDGSLLPRAPRTRICEDWVPGTFGIDARAQGVWYRCCEGKVRKLVDCCSTHDTRINGDEPLPGYCYGKRRVFCVMYFDSEISC